jgi:hypothetical protein
VIEWERGSNVIADFTWPCGLYELVVSDRVRSCIETHGFSGITFEPVEMIQKKGLKKPLKVSRAKPRVWLPYEGPPLWNLVVTSWCDMDLPASGRSYVLDCNECGKKHMLIHDPTAPLVVNPETWSGTDFFCMRDLYKLVFVRESVKSVLKENGFTNLQIKERGFIPGPDESA